MELKGLYDKRGRLVTEMKKMSRDLTKSDFKYSTKVQDEFYKLGEEIDEIDLKIDSILILDEAEGIRTVSDTEIIKEFAPGATGAPRATGKERFLTDTGGQKHRIYGKGEKIAKPYNLLTPAEYLKSLVFGAKNEVEERALSTGSGQTLITEFSNQFIDLLRNYSVVFRAGAEIVKIEGDSKKYTRGTSDATAAWKSESGSISPSDPGFETLSLDSEALLMITRVSTQSHMDSVNLGEALVTMARNAYAKELDNAALEGSGASPVPEGLFNYTDISSVDMSAGDRVGKWSDKGYTPILNSLFELHSDNEVGPYSMIMSPRTYRDLFDTSDSTGQPLNMPASISEIPKFITGSGVISDTRQLAASGNECSTLYLGNFSKLWYVSRLEFSVQVLDQRYAENYEIGLLFTLRGSWKPMHEKSFSKLIGILDEDSVNT